jgi:hypothetical protein
VEESVPDLRRQAAALLAGTIDFKQFEYWFIMNDTAIEQHGSEEEVDFLNDVWNLHAELTGDHISVGQFIVALREMCEVGAPSEAPSPGTSP